MIELIGEIGGAHKVIDRAIQILPTRRPADQQQKNVVLRRMPLT
jgi:hypothetical protein